MPKKAKFRKVKKDAKQDKRIKSLEKFVYKTLENKQVNYNNTGGNNITTDGYVGSQFLALDTGAEDGGNLGSPSRIGNTITLMKQEINCYMTQSVTDSYNRVRMLIVESVNGNQALALDDVLLYTDYNAQGDIVFASPYTTKNETNKRYKVHLDRTFELNSAANGASRVIKHTIRYRQGGSKGKLVDYDGPDSVNANNHRLSIMWISDSDAVSHPIAHYSVRSTYKDA